MEQHYGQTQKTTDDDRETSPLRAVRLPTGQTFDDPAPILAGKLKPAAQLGPIRLKSGRGLPVTADSSSNNAHSVASMAKAFVGAWPSDDAVVMPATLLTVTVGL